MKTRSTREEPLSTNQTPPSPSAVHSHQHRCQSPAARLLWQDLQLWSHRRAKTQNLPAPLCLLWLKDISTGKRLWAQKSHIEPLAGLAVALIEGTARLFAPLPGGTSSRYSIVTWQHRFFFSNFDFEQNTTLVSKRNTTWGGRWTLLNRWDKTETAGRETKTAPITWRGIQPETASSRERVQSITFSR